VNDFTEEEANVYLNKLGFSQDKKIREFVFKKIGTRPLDLGDLVASPMKPEEFIEDRIQKNTEAVKEILKVDESNFYLNLFKEMLKKENEDGLESGTCMDILNLPNDIIVNGPAFKGNHVLTYDFVHFKYKFHSNSMREATRRLFEEKDI
jgi:hypothetical protein